MTPLKLTQEMKNEIVKLIKQTLEKAFKRVNKEQQFVMLKEPALTSWLISAIDVEPDTQVSQPTPDIDMCQDCHDRDTTYLLAENERWRNGARKLATELFWETNTKYPAKKIVEVSGLTHEEIWGDDEPELSKPISSVKEPDAELNATLKKVRDELIDKKRWMFYGDYVSQENINEIFSKYIKEE